MRRLTIIETVILGGPTEAVMRFADAVRAQPGVRHGSFNPIPIEIDAPGPKAHRHLHAEPST
jgi:CopG family nickel-responsive transcriptional regulator